MTGFVVKSAHTKTMLDAIIAMKPAQGTGPILIVDDDTQVGQSHKLLVEEGLPDYPIRLTEDGESALPLLNWEIAEAVGVSEDYLLQPCIP